MARTIWHSGAIRIRKNRMPAPAPSLETTVGSLTLKNPFLLASGPPAASGEQIRRAFRLGWAGAVTKTIVPDTMEIRDVSPRFAAWKDGNSRSPSWGSAGYPAGRTPPST